MWDIVTKLFSTVTGYFAVNIVCHLIVGKARAGYHFSSEIIIIIYPYLVEVLFILSKEFLALRFHFAGFGFLLSHFNRSYRFCLTAFVQRADFRNMNVPWTWTLLMIILFFCFRINFSIYNEKYDYYIELQNLERDLEQN